MCSPSTPSAPPPQEKPDPLRVLLSRDKFKGGTGGYLLPPRQVDQRTFGSSPGTSVSAGLNVIK